MTPPGHAGGAGSTDGTDGTVTFIVPELDRPSGGSIYNAKVVEHWPTSAPPLRVAVVNGVWPNGERGGTASLANAVREAGSIILIDGLVGAAHPRLVQSAVDSGRRVALLVHQPLGEAARPARDQLALAEAESISACGRVLVTSHSTGLSVSNRSPAAIVSVAEPGVDPAPVAAGSRPPRFLTVGALQPDKNQHLVIDALAACAHQPGGTYAFSAQLVGPTVDDAYADVLAQKAQQPELAGRIEFAGVLLGADMARAYQSADLLVAPSRTETYGMTVTEALARGIPAIVGRGTGAEHTLGDTHAGTAVAVDDPTELTETLTRWLTDAETRRSWREAALDVRPTLRTWSDTAANVAAACRA